MRHTLLVTLLALTFGLPFHLAAQISQGGCDDFKNYKTLKEQRTGLADMRFDIPITTYADTEREALYQAKIQVLRDLTGNQMYLNNPRVDSIFAEFAGEIILFHPNEYDLFRTRRRDRDKGRYTCMVHRTKYNPELIEYLQHHINNFIKYSVTFIINPYIDQEGDAPTKGLYNKALNTFYTLCLQPKYKFDNVIEDRLLEKSKLQTRPTDYNPALGYQSYETGNKYLDYVTAITNNANRSRQVDVIFSMDTISVTSLQNSNERLVRFHIIGYSTHTASMIMAYDSEVKIEASNDYDAVDRAIPIAFARDIDNYMYDISRRYANYVRDGMQFSVKISDTLINPAIEMMLAQSMLDCKLFSEASISPGVWRHQGQQIGKSFEGRTYLLNRLRLQIMIIQMLQNVGIKDFVVDVSGTDFIVSPEK